jgi:CheY-specific phosphatase CheX
MIVEATIDVCAAMHGITLGLSGEPFSFSMSHIRSIEVGSCVTICGPETNWSLAIFCSELCCKQLAAHMMGKTPADIGQEEMVDAFGETLNIVAGVAKRKIPTNDSHSIVIGLPSFIAGYNCVKYLTTGIDVCCQLLSAPDSTIELAVAWKEEELL